jgi:PEP-CTERM motif
MKSLCLQREDADARMQSSQNFSKGRLKVEIDMKFELKSLVVAAAFAAAGMANAATVTANVGQTIRVTDDARGAASTNRQADITLQSAGGALYFSNGTADPTATPPAKLNSVGGLVGALNVGKTVVTGVDGAVVTQSNLPVGATNRSTRAIVNIGANVTGLVADTSTGVFSIVNTIGGANQTSPWIDGVLDGGTVTVKNLRVDLINKQVFADLIGRPLISYDDPTLVYGDEVVFSGALWNIGSISGPTSLPPSELLAAADGNTSALTARGYVINSVNDIVVNGVTVKDYNVTATNLLSKLTVTDDGFAAFAKTLGLVEGSTGYTTLAGVNGGATGWGTLKSAITFSAHEVPAVPEPSTYAMMAIGLVGLGFAARRRAAK